MQTKIRIVVYEILLEMSVTNIFLIATIALILIIVLFYALEKCAKFLDSTSNFEQKRKLSVKH